MLHLHHMFMFCSYEFHIFVLHLGLDPGPKSDSFDIFQVMSFSCDFHIFVYPWAGLASTTRLINYVDVVEILRMDRLANVDFPEYGNHMKMI